MRPCWSSTTRASRFAVESVLSRAGHRVTAVGSGAEALAEIDVRLRKGNLPDVALIDVHLPDMSGFELCGLLKERPRMAGLPVVHVSALAAPPSNRCQALDAGDEAFLTVRLRSPRRSRRPSGPRSAPPSCGPTTRRSSSG